MKKLEETIIKKIESLYSEGNSLNLISKDLNISKATVSYYINKAGLSRYSMPVIITETLLNKMQEDYDSGLTLTEISKKYKIALGRLQEIKRHLPKNLSGYEILKSRRCRIKEELIKHKGGKCEVCGYNKCLSALEFHHLNPKEKDFSIAQTTTYKNMDLLKSEIDKCILVCANCHREIHAGLVNL